MTVLSSILYLLICFVGSTLLTRSLAGAFRSDHTVARALTWITVFFTGFFGAFHLLGYVNLFTNLPAVDARYASGVALVVFIGARRWLGRTMAGMAAAGTAAERPRLVTKRRFLPGNGLGRAVAAASIAVFALMALMLSVGFPRGYEAQGYHLPIAVEIFQAHSLKIWRVWETIFFHTLPANASIYFGFLLGLVPEHLVAPAGLVFLAVLAMAAYGIGRASGADETASLLASLGFVTIPIVTAPAMDAVSDIGGLAFLGIALYFVVSKPTGRSQDLMLSGLAAGLSFGFKSLHLVGIAFLFLVIVLQTWSRRSARPAVESTLWGSIQPLVVFLAATFATSGFWLVRNYVQLGNPLYPVHLRVFDIFGWTTGGLPETLMPQSVWVRSSAEWLVYPWVEWLRPGENVFSKHAPGLFFAATVPVACLVTFLAVLTRKTRRPLVALALLAGGPFILAIQMWVINDRQPRHFMGALVFLVPLVAWTIAQAAGLYRRVLECMVALCVSTVLLMTLSLEAIEFGTRFIYGRQFARPSFYQYPEAIDHLPPRSTVVNLGHRTRNYSLSGARRQNRIVNYMEALSALGAFLVEHNPDQAPEVIPLSQPVLQQLNATHLLTEGYPRIVPDQCVTLQKIDGVDKDVFGNSLSDPINLYEIEFCR